MNDLDKASQLIKQDDLVVIPTETVYGLAASIYSEDAIKKIFKLKERPFFDPLIVHVSSIEMAHQLTTNWDKTCEVLAQNFWPGPLTIVIPKNDKISDLITSGLPDVGLRCPDNKLTLELIEKLNTPLAAPSANKFTKTSPTKASHVTDEFGDNVFILDDGPCSVGIESTVIGIKPEGIQIYRPGSITKTQIESVLKLAGISLEVNIGESPVSPGALKHHYMPNKPITLVTENTVIDESVSAWIVPHDATIASRELYSKLRDMDKEETDSITIVLKESFKSNEHFSGFLNRLDKAKTVDKYFI
jgi:L-threonylcarbamoyladenylate synthase